jgi:hypothetical protein
LKGLNFAAVQSEVIADKVVEGARRLVKERVWERKDHREAALIQRKISFQEKPEEHLAKRDLELTQCSGIRHDGKKEHNGHGGGNWHRGGGGRP